MVTGRPRVILGGAAGEARGANGAYAPAYPLLAPARRLQALPAPSELKCCADAGACGQVPRTGRAVECAPQLCHGAVPSRVITLFSHFITGTKTMSELPKHVAKLSVAHRVLGPGCVSWGDLATVSPPVRLPSTELARTRSSDCLLRAGRAGHGVALGLGKEKPFRGASLNLLGSGSSLRLPNRLS